MIVWDHCFVFTNDTLPSISIPRGPCTQIPGSKNGLLLSHPLVWLLERSEGGMQSHRTETRFPIFGTKRNNRESMAGSRFRGLKSEVFFSDKIVRCLRRTSVPVHGIHEEHINYGNASNGKLTLANPVRPLVGSVYPYNKVDNALPCASV